MPSWWVGFTKALYNGKAPPIKGHPLSYRLYIIQHTHRSANSPTEAEARWKNVRTQWFYQFMRPDQEEPLLTSPSSSITTIYIQWRLVDHWLKLSQQKRLFLEKMMMEICSNALSIRAFHTKDRRICSTIFFAMTDGASLQVPANKIRRCTFYPYPPLSMALRCQG